MLQWIAYIALAALFVFEIVLLKVVFNLQTKKELKTLLEGWETQKQYELEPAKDPKLVVTKLPSTKKGPN